MTTTKKLRTVKPATDGNGKISAFSMVLALVQSGCSMDNMKLAQQLTAAERQQIEELTA